MQQAAKTAVTLGALCGVLAIVGIWGWNAATEPSVFSQNSPVTSMP